MEMQTSPAWQRRSALGLGAFAALTAGAASIGARATRPATKQLWYRRLEKPPFQPPAAVFPVAWTALYALIAVSGWRVWRKPSGPSRSLALELWGLQLGLNAAWSWLFFGQQSIGGALADIIALWLAIAATIVAAWPRDRAAATLLMPYWAWVTFAATLNLALWRLN
jgi:tryptophan-rich sensory protein